jgi:hypothetical protein
MAVPAHQHPLERGALGLHKGHDHDRPPGFKQRPFDQELLGGAFLGPGLPDHREVEAARDAPEQIGGARHAGVEDAHLGRKPGTAGRGFEPAGRGFRGLGVLLALGFDQIGRDAAQHGARDHRLVDEADARNVGIEQLCQRDRIVGREFLRGCAGQVDHDVLDHGIRSSPAESIAARRP